MHRPVHLDYVGVKKFDEQGEVVGERRFLGLFSSAAYTESVRRIPVLREKAAEVIDTVGLDPMSHAGKALMDVLETYPRDELFQTPVEDLVPIASQVMYTRERRQLKLFVRRDIYGRFLSCLVYLPRDRYNTTVRERIAAILKEQLAGRPDRVHRARGGVLRRAAALRRTPGRGRADRRAGHRRPRAPLRRGGPLLARRLQLGGHLHLRRGAGQPPACARTPSASRRPTRRTTRRRPGPSTSAASSRSRATRGSALSLYEEIGAPPGEARLKVFRIGPPLSLSEVLPILSTTGVEVVDERPYQLEGLDRESYIYDFGLRHDQPMPDRARELFQDTVSAVWDGYNESDGFNALVLAAGLTWRQATVLRAYAKYMRQGGTPFAQDYIEDALRNNVEITRYLVQLFEARFDPGTARRPGRRRRGPRGQVRRPRRTASRVRSTTSPASTTTGSCGPT